MGRSQAHGPAGGVVVWVLGVPLGAEFLVFFEGSGFGVYGFNGRRFRDFGKQVGILSNHGLGVQGLGRVDGMMGL